MNLTGKPLLQLDQAACKRLSCLVSCGCGQIGVDRGSGEICSISGGEVAGRQSPARPYSKITFCPQTCGYFAVCPRVPGCIFALDPHFREIDCIRASLEPSSLPVEDIWFDGETQLLWLVTRTQIYRLNGNGDLLGVFMTAPSKAEYKALCTYHKFVFVASARGGCTSIASYTAQGAYLERVSIGNEYTVCNLQALDGGDGPYLQVFAIRDHQFPAALRVELNGGEKETPPCGLEQTGGFCVEYGTESPGLRATCRLSAPCPGNAPQGPVIG